MRQFDDIKRDIYDSTPHYYHEIAESQEILDKQAELLSELYTSANDVLDQMFIDTATWGLPYWERLANIKEPSQSTFEAMEKDGLTFSEMEDLRWSIIEIKFPADIEGRRSRIKALLRGFGTITLDHIKTVVSAYSHGEVDVINDPINYRIIIRFISEDAIPDNLEQVKTLIRDLAPAHLALEYSLMYLLIKDIDQTITLSALETKTLSEFAGGGTFGE